MARIRTIKPEFFRDEDLQDLELKHPDARPMLVFAGLWGHCDKQGVFEWKPRSLKLDILPFLPFEMEVTLSLLEATGLIEKFESEGKVYGFIDSFTDHQRIGGKEHSDPAKHPGKPRKQRGSTGEAPEQHSGLQEGKGREGIWKGEEGKGMEGKGNAREIDAAAPPGQEPETGDLTGQTSPPEEPPSRRGPAAERRNGAFENITESVSKLLASGAYKPHEYGGIAQALHVSKLQVEVAVRQLRDRGRLPAGVAA